MMRLKQPEDMEMEYSMALPEAATYADVHIGKDIPELTMERLVQYFDEQQKSFDDKYHLLYNQRQV